MNLNTVVLLLSNLTSTAGIGFLLWMLPRMNRGDMVFGITVPPEFASSRTVSDAFKRYRGHVVMHSTLWFAVALIAGLVGFADPKFADRILLVLLSLSPFALLIAALFAHQHGRRNLLSHSVQPTQVREASLGVPRPILSTCAKLTAAGPVCLILATAIILCLFWNHIPVRYPSHWNAHGSIDGWTTRNPLQVGAPLFLGLFVNAFLLILFGILSRQVRPLHASGEAACYEAQAKSAMFAIVTAVCYFVTVPICAMTLYLPLGHNSEALPGWTLIFVVIAELGLLAVLAVLMTRVADSMEKARKAAGLAADGRVIGDRTEDRYWKWGMFYYNPGDPAVWVDKRIGAGWTTNMARWQGWAWTFGLVLGPLLLVLLILFGLS